MYYDKTAIDQDNITKDIEVINQTRRYLIPQFRDYGNEFIDKVRSLNVKGMFLQDYGINITQESRDIKPQIYFLFDVNGPVRYGHYDDVKKSRISFMESLQWFRQKPYYVIDYPFDSNKDGHLHVIVFKLPKPETLTTFLKGEYSKMYTKEEVNKWIPKNYIDIENGKEVSKYTITYQVITRHPDYFEIFRDKICEELGVRESSVSPKAEYDFPPYIPNEVLRYK